MLISTLVPSNDPQFRVGDVCFYASHEEGKVFCHLCSANMQANRAAAHARRKHAKQAKGVLTGQLGLPFTRTPDVPR
jgi:hypothetical protein